MSEVEMNDKILIETRNLTKIYSNGAEVHALDDVNIRVRRGEFLTVMGPSGSGKSTLLNMLGALDRPTSGEVFINGQELTTVKDLDSFRAQTVGFIFQLHNLIPTLNARENVEVPMMGQDMSAKQRRERSKELLELVGLGNRMDHLPNQLSGGQRQRVAVARALANRPALVLADEPTGNLDTQSGSEVVDLMRDLNEELETTFVIVTHDHAVARQTERVLVMQDGRIVDDHRVGDPFEEDLKAFRDSGLGQALIEGDGSLPEWLDRREQELLREILQS
jgi:ABC-type lipoprotein export system ATPase subunit